MNFDPPVIFTNSMPTKKALLECLKEPPTALVLIYDRKLVKFKSFQKWSEMFELKYSVSAGEDLKEAEAFPKHLKKLFRLIGDQSSRHICFVGAGGGSVGDFTGFLASVFKRGVSYLQIPSTLLASIDSAHGGKTALNLGSFKNQVGTFYPPEGIFIVKSLLEGLSNKQVESAHGELAKAALIKGGNFFKNLMETPLDGFDMIWEFLPEGVKTKTDIVKEDPFEVKGERLILNLGHTLAHIIEPHYKLAHGISVGLGLIFAIRWSVHRGYIRDSQHEKVLKFLRKKMQCRKPEKVISGKGKMSRKAFRKLLEQDKKAVDNQRIQFVFLKDIGKPFVKTVTMDSVVIEAHRQGWI